MDMHQYTLFPLEPFEVVPSAVSVVEGRVPRKSGTRGCTRGHDPALYVCQPSGVFVCRGCKRENNNKYKQRMRGRLEPFSKKVRWCACGCGGHPRRGEYLRGHRPKTGCSTAVKKAGMKRWREAIRYAVLSRYGRDGEPICVHCGFTDIRALSLDHMQGNGNMHRRAIKKWLYLWIKQQGFPTGYQTLCMNCQMIKAEQEGERPGPIASLA
jgi:hypothetical protein